MNVTVLLLSNRHGRDVYVCADFDVAYRQLEQYVDKWWGEAMCCDMSKCGNCPVIQPTESLAPIEDIAERVMLGDTVPSGQCPVCGALCYTIGVQVLDKPEGVDEDADEKIGRYFEAMGEWESYEFFDEPVIGLDVKLPCWAWNVLAEALGAAIQGSVLSLGLREEVARALQATEVIEG